MAFRIATDLINAIVAEAAASPDVEVCGLLLGKANPLPPSSLSPSKGVSQTAGSGHVLRLTQHDRGGGDSINGGTITEIRPCHNVAANPARRFEIDPVALLAAHRQAREGGPAILGCYHSHPMGMAQPSAQDAADAAPNGWLWIIATTATATAWQAVERSGLISRFEAVELAP